MTLPGTPQARGRRSGYRDRSARSGNGGDADSDDDDDGAASISSSKLIRTVSGIVPRSSTVLNTPVLTMLALPGRTALDYAEALGDKSLWRLLLSHSSPRMSQVRACCCGFIARG